MGTTATLVGMTAFQRLAATTVVPVSTSVQTFLPIVLEPVFLRERWASANLDGAPIAAEDNTAMPAEFLMRQMAWREALDDATRRPAVEAIASDLDAHRRQAYADLARSLDEATEYTGAAQQVRALMFVERFADDVADRLEAMEA